MGKKKLLGLSTLLLFVQTTAAQTTGGIIPLLAEVLGLPIEGSIYTAIGTAAILGEMIILLYIPMKIGARKLGIEEDVIGSGRSGGRNIALILSTLMVLSLLGVTAQGFGFTFGSIIEAYGALSIIAVLGIAVLGIFITLAFLGSGGQGMLSMVGGGGKKLQAQGTALKAEAEAERQEAQSILDEVRQGEQEEEEAQSILERVRNMDIGGEDDAEEAAEAIEQALEKLERIQQLSSRDLEKDREEVEEAIELVREELELEDDEHQRAVNVDQRMKRAETYVELAANAASGLPDSITDRDIHLGLIEGKDKTSGGMTANFNHTSDVESATSADLNGVTLDSGSFYGLQSVYDDLNKSRKQVQNISKDVQQENNDEQKALNELLGAVKVLRELHKEIVELQDLIEEARDEDQSLEKLAESRNWKDLYGMAEHELDEEESLEQGEEKLRKEEEKIVTEMKKGMKLINEHMKEDSDIIDALNDALRNGTTLEDYVESQLIPKFDNLADSDKDSSVWSNGDARNGLEGVANLVKGLDSELDTLEDQDELEARNDREFLDEINDYLDDL